MFRKIGMVLVGAGAYFLWRNRFEVERLLERYREEDTQDSTSTARLSA